MITKTPTCKLCGGPHYKTFCFNAPKKALKVNKPLITSRPKKPVKQAVKRPKTKPSERQAAVKHLDRVFSIYIRRKDAIGGIARCVTCGNAKPWRLQQNGHFLSRRIVATRWDEKNCHVQCSDCNERLHGNLYVYEQYLYSKYGPDIVFYLRDKANQPNKISTPEIKDLVKVYKKKLKALDK